MIPLRPYQEEAIAQAVERKSLLLALVQGAGKTRVAIETVEHLVVEGGPLCGAVFCPATLKYQWAESEIPKWSPTATVRVIDGDKATRTRQYQAPPARYTILNYECLIHDWELIKQHLSIDFIICDEVTAIKGLRAKRSRRMKSMAKRVPIRLALSGQPVENRPEELFSIMEFVDPTVLGRFDKFDRTFIRRNQWGRPQRYVNLPLLNRTMEGAMFRRSREDIAEYLPERLEVDFPVHLDPPTRKLYEYVRKDCLDVIAEAVASGMGGFNLLAHYGHSADDQQNRLKGQIMARVTAMRLLCSHPRLLQLSADAFDDPDTPYGSEYCSQLKADDLFVEIFKSPNTSSPKLDLLLDQIIEILAEDSTNKVVVFSGFKPTLAIIGDHLRAAKIGYTTITGDTPTRMREQRRDRFNTDPRCHVFLSSDAGAYGINLDGGSHLFCFDLPWSAGVLGQRVARIDRTSSRHRTINIGYLFAANTIEEHQRGLLVQKQRVGEAFIDGKHSDQHGQMGLTLDSLSASLRT